MFPFEIDEEELEVEGASVVPYKEYEIDFETGQLTGRVVEGREAVKVWIYFAFHIGRDYFEQYTWDYGNEFQKLIGGMADPEYIELEARRMAEECLMRNPHILGIREFECRVEDDGITMGMSVSTEYGEVEFDV